MRCLTRQFAIGALRRRHGIEQFLGEAEIHGEPAIRWVAISPANRRDGVANAVRATPPQHDSGEWVERGIGITPEAVMRHSAHPSARFVPLDNAPPSPVSLAFDPGADRRLKEGFVEVARRARG
ncbi:hypothetical protein [Catenuloplanes japonicus]|uniref:hypothetical protein n=1 Tax=Catenuloplanes japonicus TaxID=33876 RepID=UPI000525B1F5|nr:hypothetical protein [Catenuloplanes japonicus]